MVSDILQYFTLCDIFEHFTKYDSMRCLHLCNSVHDFGVKMYFSAFMFSMIELSFCINDSGDTEQHSAYG